MSLRSQCDGRWHYTEGMAVSVDGVEQHSGEDNPLGMTGVVPCRGLCAFKK